VKGKTSLLSAREPVNGTPRQAEVLSFAAGSLRPGKQPPALALRPKKPRLRPLVRTTQDHPSLQSLRKLEFFKQMSDEQLKLVARSTRMRSFRNGQIVIKENGPADHFFIILSGQVQISKMLESGEQTELSTESRGGFFGEMALLDEGRRSATARALEPTTLLEISRNDFKVLLSKAPLLADAMMRVLSSRLRDAEALMISKLQRKNQDLSRAYLDTIKAVVNTLEARDSYTRGHTERVRTIAKYIAGRMGLTGEDMFNIEIGALLHDVGKIGVTDAILRKKSALDRTEEAELQEHPTKGRLILHDVAFLKKAIPCVLHHHERFDGLGYPEHLAGRDIPLPGRIIAVADAFDAMTSNRPYRKRMQVSSALAELKQGAGRQFDPDVVRAFLWVWKHESLAGLVRRRKQPPVAESSPEAGQSPPAAARKSLALLAAQALHRLLASIRAHIRLGR
jgi:HD-GYP domain-containing protein (c-di-GMP phosphodiesterase class II)